MPRAPPRNVQELRGRPTLGMAVPVSSEAGLGLGQVGKPVPRGPSFPCISLGHTVSFGPSLTREDSGGLKKTRGGGWVCGEQGS